MTWIKRLWRGDSIETKAEVKDKISLFLNAPPPKCTIGDSVMLELHRGNNGYEYTTKIENIGKWMNRLSNYICCLKVRDAQAAEAISKDLAGLGKALNAYANSRYVIPEVINNINKGASTLALVGEVFKDNAAHFSSDGISASTYEDLCHLKRMESFYLDILNLKAKFEKQIPYIDIPERGSSLGRSGLPSQR